MTGIKDSSEIVGFYVDNNDVQRGFCTNPASVPEPPSIVLTGLALLGAVVLKKRRLLDT